MSHLRIRPANVKLPRIRIVGENGNAFAIMARWDKAAKKAGWTEGHRSAVLTHARSSDYDHLLLTIMDHVDPEVLERQMAVDEPQCGHPECDDERCIYEGGDYE